MTDLGRMRSVPGETALRVGAAVLFGLPLASVLQAIVSAWTAFGVIELESKLDKPPLVPGLSDDEIAEDLALTRTGLSPAGSDQLILTHPPVLHQSPGA